VSKEKEADRVILRMRRTIKAPRDLVFNAWTKPEMLARWWGNAAVAVDLRPGGGYRVEMKHPDGSMSAVVGRYVEIDPPKKLVFTFNWEGDPGAETVAHVEFLDLKGQTEIVLTQDVTENANACEEGWAGTFDRLEILAAKDFVAA
jgi:uncharacterized protein YndB with AHSA1/START domain